MVKKQAKQKHTHRHHASKTRCCSNVWTSRDRKCTLRVGQIAALTSKLLCHYWQTQNKCNKYYVLSKMSKITLQNMMQ